LRIEAARESGRADLSGSGSVRSSPAGRSLHPVLQLQRQAGNQAVQKLLRSGLIQAKLTISSPGDPEEQEADQVADQVMRAHAGFPVSAPCTCAEGNENCEDCRQTSPVIQRRADAKNARPSGATVNPVLRRESGHPLDAATRAFFEPRFDRDFSDVRVHTDSTASESARSIDARAFTIDRSIAFAEGQYSPETSEGQKLLAHELTHTIQQGEGLVRRQPADQGSPDSQNGGPGGAPQSSVPAQSLDERYEAALQDSRRSGNWQTTAELLNGFNRVDIETRLARLSPAEIGYLHNGAVTNSLVGPDSQVAQMTVPGAPQASTPEPAVTPAAPATTPAAPTPGPPQLVQSFRGWVAERNWPEAAETLNGFNETDIHTLLASCSPEQIASIHQGALDNPRVGPDSQVALLTAPSFTPPAAPAETTGGDYDDYKTNPDYLDNYGSAAYDPWSNTIHLFFPDGGEAIVRLPLTSGPVLVFEKKSLLSSPGPNDLKIYPTVQDRARLPNLVQWLAEHQTEIEQSRLLLNAGVGTLSARSVPPDLWWLALLAPAAGLTARFSGLKMRPAGGTVEHEQGESPIIKAPNGKPGGPSGPAEEPPLPNPPKTPDEVDVPHEGPSPPKEPVVPNENPANLQSVGWADSEVQEMLSLGHASERHGPSKTQAELSERILSDKAIHSSSKWYREEDLAPTVRDILNQNDADIRKWLADAKAGNNAQNLELDQKPAGKPIGEGYIRRSGGNPRKTEIAVEWIVDINRVTVILKLGGPRGFYVLTAFPEPLEAL
jgi:hypothetical protein